MFGLFKKKQPVPLAPNSSGINLRKRTLACLVLDESGSMNHLKAATIEGVNSFIESLKVDNGDDVLFSLYTFASGVSNEDQDVKTLYCNRPINNVRHISNKDYVPHGGTPLYDAVGMALDDMQKEAKEGELVIFAILTDGEENSSQRYTSSYIKSSIERLTLKGWKFSFLGVGVNAFSMYQNMGATADTSFNLGTSAQAVSNTYAAMSTNSATMRSAYSQNNLQATVNLNVILTKDKDNIK